jgi:tetratricopeptide (TPR) repeat protein
MLCARFHAMRTLIPCACLLLGHFCFATDCNDHSLQALFDSHQLFELRNAINNGNAPLFYRGVVACSLNDLGDCEKRLGAVIKSTPIPKEARDARNTLASAYFRSGRYREALSQLNAIIAANPDDPVRTAYPLVVALAKLPDQSTVRSKPSKVPLHPWGNDLAIPLTINGLPATYAFDTGNFAVAISFSEATRLRLTIYPADANVTVNGVPVRVALADRMAVGNFRFKNVAFIVFPDDQEPFSDMPAGERGLIGLPTLLAFHNFSWSSDRVFTFGLSGSKIASAPNISFDGQYLTAQVEFRNSKLTLGLDTGAETTRLGPRFAQTFSELLKERGEKSSKQVDQIGASLQIDSILLPKLELRIAGFPAVLQPAYILSAPDSGCSYGTLGMDVMKQSHRTTIDFQNMTLTMQ